MAKVPPGPDATPRKNGSVASPTYTSKISWTPLKLSAEIPSEAPFRAPLKIDYTQAAGDLPTPTKDSQGIPPGVLRHVTPQPYKYNETSPKVTSVKAPDSAVQPKEAITSFPSAPPLPITADLNKISTDPKDSKGIPPSILRKATSQPYKTSDTNSPKAVSVKDPSSAIDPNKTVNAPPKTDPAGSNKISAAPNDSKGIPQSLLSNVTPQPYKYTETSPKWASVKAPGSAAEPNERAAAVSRPIVPSLPSGNKNDSKQVPESQQFSPADQNQRASTGTSAPQNRFSLASNKLSAVSSETPASSFPVSTVSSVPTLVPDKKSAPAASAHSSRHTVGFAQPPASQVELLANLTSAKTEHGTESSAKSTTESGKTDTEPKKSGINPFAGKTDTEPKKSGTEPQNTGITSVPTKSDPRKSGTTSAPGNLDPEPRKSGSKSVPAKSDPEPRKSGTTTVPAKSDPEPRKSGTTSVPAKSDPEPRKSGTTSVPAKSDPEPRKSGTASVPAKSDPEPRKSGTTSVPANSEPEPRKSEHKPRRSSSNTYSKRGDSSPFPPQSAIDIFQDKYGVSHGVNAGSRTLNRISSQRSGLSSNISDLGSSASALSQRTSQQIIPSDRIISSSSRPRFTESGYKRSIPPQAKQNQPLRKSSAVSDRDRRRTTEPSRVKDSSVVARKGSSFQQSPRVQQSPSSNKPRPSGDRRRRDTSEKQSPGGDNCKPPDKGACQFEKCSPDCDDKTLKAELEKCKAVCNTKTVKSELDKCLSECEEKARKSNLEKCLSVCDDKTRKPGLEECSPDRRRDCDYKTGNTDYGNRWQPSCVSTSNYYPCPQRRSCCPPLSRYRSGPMCDSYYANSCEPPPCPRPVCTRPCDPCPRPRCPRPCSPSPRSVCPRQCSPCQRPACPTSYTPCPRPICPRPCQRPMCPTPYTPCPRPVCPRSCSPPACPPCEPPVFRQACSPRQCTPCPRPCSPCLPPVFSIGCPPPPCSSNQCRPQQDSYEAAPNSNVGCQQPMSYPYTCREDCCDPECDPNRCKPLVKPASREIPDNFKCIPNQQQQFLIKAYLRNAAAATATATNIYGGTGGCCTSELIGDVCTSPVAAALNSGVLRHVNPSEIGKNRCSTVQPTPELQRILDYRRQIEDEWEAIAAEEYYSERPDGGNNNNCYCPRGRPQRPGCC